MRIEVCYGTKVITVGECKFEEFSKRKMKDWVSHILTGNRKKISTYPPKNFYKEAAAFLECNPSCLFKAFEKLQYKLFVVPYLEYATKIAFNKNGVDPYILYGIVKNKELLDQAKQDGLMHLIPIIAKLGKSPADLKSNYGKDWKVIANNSLTKNKYLSKLPSVHIGSYARFPVTLLKQTRLFSYTDSSVCLVEHLTLHYKGKWKYMSNLDNFRDVQLFIDTERLADKLGKKVNPKWSPRRVKEEHDAMSKEITARLYTKEKYKALDSVVAKTAKTVKHNNLTAYLIESPFDLAEEGREMSHCLAGYNELVQQGSYLAYSIRGASGERLSTLGINVRTKPIFDASISPLYSYNQHYGKFNKGVSSDDEIQLANKVLRVLNY